MMLLAVISEGSLARRKPPFLPLTVVTSPADQREENMCSRYFSDMSCLFAISERKTGFPSPWLRARSIMARRPYLPFVDTFMGRTLCFVGGSYRRVRGGCRIQSRE